MCVNAAVSVDVWAKGDEDGTAVEARDGEGGEDERLVSRRASSVRHTSCLGSFDGAVSEGCKEDGADSNSASTKRAVDSTACGIPALRSDQAWIRAQASRCEVGVAGSVGEPKRRVRTSMRSEGVRQGVGM